MGNFHSIPKDVKEQILLRIKSEGVLVRDLARDHGIAETTIYGWLKKSASPQINFLEHARLKRENKLLLELIGKLTLEKEKVVNFKKNWIFENYGKERKQNKIG